MIFISCSNNITRSAEQLMLFAMSVKMMLDRRGYKEAGQAVENAVHKVLEEGKVLTYDLGGTAKCSEVGKEIASRV